MVRWHLSWQRNGDSLDVGLAANRLLLSGRGVWWCRRSGRTEEAGDYLVEAEADLSERLAALGIEARRFTGAVPPSAVSLPAPCAALLAGAASAYPYFAHYALCLLRLGVGYRPVDGRAIAAGALAGATLFVLPGGFALWGLDTAESSPGADAAVRAFLREGGRCLGSCGGAYYLSAGRPAWTGTAWARPRFTHEYLQSGAGIVAVALRRTPIAFGLPDSIEMPYYHGPIYEDLPASVTVLGRFKALILPGRLGIENPLAASRFADDMAGRPAILSAAGRRGHAILFSPHPEMGDLVRKYLALDGYVRKYLPKRGRRTMEDTLAAYRPLDAPAFRLVLNAVHDLSWTGRRVPAARRASPFPALARIARAGARKGNRRMPWGQAVASGAMPGGAAEDAEREGIAQRAAKGLRRLRKAAADRLARFSPPEQGEYGGVLRRAAEQLESRIGPSAAALQAEMRRLPDTLSPAGYRVCDSWRHLAAAAAAGLERRPETPRPAAEELLQAELALSLMDAVRRCLEFDRALGRRERKR